MTNVYECLCVCGEKKKKKEFEVQKVIDWQGVDREGPQEGLLGC